MFMLARYQHFLGYVNKQWYEEISDFASFEQLSLPLYIHLRLNIFSNSPLFIIASALIHPA